MTTPPGPLPGSVEKPTVYRGPGAVFGGALVFLFCLGGGFDLIIEEGTVDLPGASVMFLVAALAFAYGVYPAAFSGQDALVVRNPLRTITIPWGIVTKLSAQLSFIAFTTTQRYTVWAVPVSIRDRRKAERARLREISRPRRSDQQRRGGAFSFGATRPGAARRSRCPPARWRENACASAPPCAGRSPRARRCPCRSGPRRPAAGCARARPGAPA